ncbi:MAG: hypothetical protein A3E84_00515 [Gammaproteobacteria bacterium RIFCSPHIGHO2_12_FULL_42_13]|nr:MAG: hypothetical protein A3E84_00515 [Gammaproteobacteria bacterium RIFCSPHIGHO2_12_FULL_42_13]
MITIKLNPSKLLLYYSIAIIVFAMGCIASVSFYYCVSLVFVCLFPQKRISTVHYLGKGRWRLNEEEHEAKLLPSSVMWRYALILHFLSDGKRENVVIIKDSMSDEDYRRLRRCVVLSA